MGITKRKFFLAALLIATVGLVSAYVITAHAQCMHDQADSPCAHEHMAMEATNQKPTATSLAAINSQQLPAIQDAVARATQHIQAGQYQAALAQLEQAQNLLKSTQAAMGQHVKPAFVNDRCPIMGAPIEAARVTPDLVREYEDQKVAFCCAGCPAAWDKLSEADRQVRLPAAIGSEEMSDHQHHS